MSRIAIPCMAASAIALLGLCAGASAQTGHRIASESFASAPAVAPSTPETTAVELTIASDGKVRGMGPGYLASFDGGNLSFRVTALEDEPALRFRTASVRRGTGSPIEIEQTAIPDADPESKLVRFQHGACEERFELHERGVKHSYVFTERPVGDGDLVVRLQLETEIASRPLPDGGLEFGEAGSIRMGQVVGIDAHGETCRGTLAVVGDSIELSLPASFVDTAALPIELDPWIHSQLEWTRFVSDATYLNTLDRYLVTWASSDGVKAVVTNGQGIAISAPTILDRNGRTPRCAAVSLRDRFVVAWLVSGGLRMVSVDANTGSTSSAVGIAGDIRYLDIAGESTTRDDDALLVYSTNRETIGWQVAVQSSGRLSVFDRTQLFDTWGVPALPATGGDSGRYLVTLFDTRLILLGAVIDRNLTTLSSGLIDASTSATALATGAYSVDGDGANWIVAWGDISFTAATEWVRCRAVTYHAARRQVAWSTPRRTLEWKSSSSAGAYYPTVAWLGESAAVTFITGDRVIRHSVNTIDCLTCETRRTVSPLATSATRLALASKFSSRSSARRDEHLVTLLERRWNWWTRQYYGSVTTVAQTARDGDATRFAGTGCGTNTQGSIDVSCAAIYKWMTVRLREATPNQPCWLLISDRTRRLACGTCTVGPYFIGNTYHMATDAMGSAQVRIRVPTLSATVGTHVYAQWWVRVPGSSGCLGAYLSPAAVIELQ